MEFSNLKLVFPSRITLEAIASRFNNESPIPLCTINGAEMTSLKEINLISQLDSLTLEHECKNALGFMEYHYRHTDDTLYCVFSLLKERKEKKEGSPPSFQSKGSSKSSSSPKLPDIILSEKEKDVSFERITYFVPSAALEPQKKIK